MVTGPFGTTRQGPRAGFAIDERFPSPAGRERPRVFVPNTAHSWCEVVVRDPVNPPSLPEVVAVASSGGNGKRYKTHNLGFLASKLRNVTSEMEPLHDSDAKCVEKRIEKHQPNSLQLPREQQKLIILLAVYFIQIVYCI